MDDMLIVEKIVAKTIDGVKKWVVVSHEGRNLGAYPYTKEGKHQAHVRMGQVEAFKERDEKKKKIKESEELIESKSITIKKDSSTGEYRVPAPDGKEAGAYYTDSKEDAISTAKDMYKRAKITDIEIKFRTVSDFDMYNEAQKDWKNIYSKCPKCKSSDIKSVNMDTKKCNSCGHKFSYDDKLKEATTISNVSKRLMDLNEAQSTWVKGSDLTPEQQKDVKAKYVHRYTGQNKPQWAKETWKDDQPYPLHFKDDKDWLENTKFAVTKTGKLCGKTKYCQASPTYPNNPELRKK